MPHYSYTKFNIIEHIMSYLGPIPRLVQNAYFLYISIFIYFQIYLNLINLLIMGIIVIKIITLPFALDG